MPDNTTNQNLDSTAASQPETEKSAGALSKKELKIRGLSLAAAASAGAEFVATDARALGAKAAKQAKKAAKEARKESAKAAKAMRKAAAAAQKSATKAAKQVAEQATQTVHETAEKAKNLVPGLQDASREPLTESAPVPVADLDLGSLTVARLREIAKDRGVTGYSRLTKAELLAALR